MARFWSDTAGIVVTLAACLEDGSSRGGAR